MRMGESLDSFRLSMNERTESRSSRWARTVDLFGNLGLQQDEEKNQ